MLKIKKTLDALQKLGFKQYIFEDGENAYYPEVRKSVNKKQTI